MSRIVINCTIKERDRFLELLQDECPFDPCVPGCGEDSDCDACIEKNIEFEINK